MSFKVGDKVKFVKSTIFHTDDVKIGEIYKIIKIAGHDVRYQVENKEWFKEEELERVDYTYEDLKKSPLGTKLTFEDGNVLVKFDNDGYKHKTCFRENSDLIKLEDKIGTLGKIIKIEEPEYRTVYEAKKEILDEAEKRYLKGIIRPFRDRVKYIKKFVFPTYNSMIEIGIERDNSTWNINLPPFKTKDMYKGMKDDKEYTLQELDL